MIDHRARTSRWRAITVRADASGYGPVPLRPLTIMEFVDEPFVLLRENFRTLVLLAGVALVPLEIVTAWVQRGTMGGLGMLQMFEDPLAAQVAVETGETGLAQVLLLQALAAVTVYAVLGGVLARVAVSSVLGERLGPADAVRATLRRWPALIGLAVLVLLVVFGVAAVAVLLIALGGVGGALLGGLLALAAVPAGVAAYVLLVPAPVIVAVEGRGPLAAARRSVQLVRRRFWAVLAAMALVLVVSGLVQWALATLPTLGTFLIGYERAWLLAAVGGIGAGIVVTPYTTLVAALVYLDARARSEGLDVQIMADRAREDVPAAAG